MEKPGMEKAGHFRIDEKSFLDAVGAMPAVKIHSRDSSGALSPPAKESPSPEEEPPPLRERTSAPDIRKAFTEQDIEEYSKRLSKYIFYSSFSLLTFATKK